MGCRPFFISNQGGFMPESISFPNPEITHPRLGVFTLQAGGSMRNAFVIAKLQESDSILDRVEFDEDGFFQGRWFDGMATGTFRPGNLMGRSVTFAPEDMPGYLKNTLRAIASTKDADGVVVGLPIDSWDHSHASGASGYIIDARLADGPNGPIMEVLPKWNKRGVELIGENLYRWFSGNIDMKEKVFEGGTLTNWPATRNDQGEIQLKPIQLSQDRGLAYFETPAAGEESFESRITKVRDAFWLFSDGWVREIFETVLVASIDDKLWSIPYSFNDEGHPVFASTDEWTEVIQVYQEAAGGSDEEDVEASAPAPEANLELDNAPESDESDDGADDGGVAPEIEIPEEDVKPVKRFLNSLSGLFGSDRSQDVGGSEAGGEPISKNQSIPNGGIDPMTLEFDKLSPEDKQAAVLAGLSGLFPRLEGESDEDYQDRLASFAKVAQSATGLDDLNTFSAEYQKSQVDVILERIEAEKNAQISAAMAEMKRKTEIAQLTLRYTTGAEFAGKAIPIVADDLEALFAGLDPVQLETVTGIFDSVLKTGLVQFTEIGSDGKREQVGATALPKEMKVHLDRHMETEGNTVEDFFKANENVLGEMGQYDLSAYAKMEDAS
jgi:hypothetical protein